MNIVSIKRDMEIIGDYDVIVAGGGPSGICAAVSSARSGANTLLIERYGVLGGNLTIGHVGPIMGNVGRGTIADELIALMDCGSKVGINQNFEQRKIDIVNWVAQSGTEVFLQAPMTDVIVENNEIKGVIIGTPSGMKAVLGKVIIDATGDGIVSYLAGAVTEKGREEDGLMQPVTIMFTVGGIDESLSISGNNYTYDVRMPESDFRQKCAMDNQKGLLPKYVSFLRLYRSSRKGECVINATQENYIDGLELSDISKAEVSLRNQMEPICEYLRKNVRGFENCYIMDSADTLGVRETRRVMGSYVMTEQDLLDGKKFDDVVVHNARFIIDIHNPVGAGQADERPVLPYDIPYRSLVPLKVKNLLTVGRCISGTHHAHSSYRVMRVCMAIGQAGGIAAAISAHSGIKPHDLDYKEIQNRLMECGAELFA